MSLIAIILAVVGFSMLCIGYVAFCVYAALGLRLRLIWWIVSLGAISIFAAIFLSSTDKILLSIATLAIVGVLLIFIDYFVSRSPKYCYAKSYWTWRVIFAGVILMYISAVWYYFVYVI